MPLIRTDTCYALGLMSGTSRDGIDAALIETDGVGYVRPVAFVDLAYSSEARSILAIACNAAMRSSEIAPDPSILACANLVSNQHISLVKRLLLESGFDPDLLAVIGFHGHTAAHSADLGWTWQAGHPQQLADELQFQVVSNLRQNDMAHGGQGAPILPVYHKALFANGDRK